MSHDTTPRSSSGDGPADGPALDADRTGPNRPDPLCEWIALTEGP